MKIGDKLKGIVIGIRFYGVFVFFEDGRIGFIYIFEIKIGYIDNIYDVFSVGDEVYV